MARHKDADYAFSDKLTSWPEVQAALLMDLRDEIKTIGQYLRNINSLLHCHNTVAIPGLLRRVVANTARPRKRKASKKK